MQRAIALIQSDLAIVELNPKKAKYFFAEKGTRMTSADKQKDGPLQGDLCLHWI